MDEQQLQSLLNQYIDGAITCTEYLNALFLALGTDETKEFWNQFAESKGDN